MIRGEDEEGAPACYGEGGESQNDGPFFLLDLRVSQGTYGEGRGGLPGVLVVPEPGEVVGSIVLVEKGLQMLPLWVDALTLTAAVVVVDVEYPPRSCVFLVSPNGTRRV